MTQKNPALWRTSSAAAAMVGLDRDQLRYRARTHANHPQPLRLNSRVWLWDTDALVKFYAARCE